jgi:hypothetical protein
VQIVIKDYDVICREETLTKVEEVTTVVNKVHGVTKEGDSGVTKVDGEIKAVGVVTKATLEEVNSLDMG